MWNRVAQVAQTAEHHKSCWSLGSRQSVVEVAGSSPAVGIGSWVAGSPLVVSCSDAGILHVGVQHLV